MADRPNESATLVAARSPVPLIQTFMPTPADPHGLPVELTHTIVERGYRDQDGIDMSHRRDYMDDSRDSSLGFWF